MNYRIYILDGRSQILECQDFEGHDDLSALDQANRFSATHPVEVWQKERLVARIGMGGEAMPNKAFVPSTRRQYQAI